MIKDKIIFHIVLHYHLILSEIFNLDVGIPVVEFEHYSWFTCLISSIFHQFSRFVYYIKVWPYRKQTPRRFANTIWDGKSAIKLLLLSFSITGFQFVCGEGQLIICVRIQFLQHAMGDICPHITSFLCMLKATYVTQQNLSQCVICDLCCLKIVILNFAGVLDYSRIFHDVTENQIKMEI